MHASGDSEAADVFDFVDEFLTDREKGRDRPLAEYLARYPRCQEAVAREYLALRSPGPEEPRSNVPGPSVSGSHGAREGEKRIGPYRILAEIGRGGQGAVFLAEDTRIARKVALKVLASRFDLVSEDRRRRFRREAEVIARLEHPGICGIYDADIDGETPYIAMRHVDGRTLAQILAEARSRDARAAGESAAPESEETDLATTWPPGSPLDVRRVLLLFERVARALHAAHEAGVVHRDVKPGNLMVTRDGQPVLLDFGLARDEQGGVEVEKLTQSGDVFGTPAYMSPEQLFGGELPLDRRTDVYSLAVSMFEALTLVRPFEAHSRLELFRRIREEPVPDPRRLNPRLSEDVKVVLETALERDRARRYPSALELAEDLRRIREYEPIRARPASVPLRFSRWMRRHPALAVSIIGTILALSSGLALTLHLLGKADSALQIALGHHLAQRCVALIPEDPALALAIGIEAADREIREGGKEKGAGYLTRAALFQALDACWLERVLSAEPAMFATDLAASPEGRILVLGTDDGFARAFDLETGSRLYDLPGPPGRLLRIFVTPDGSRIVTASSTGRVQVFDAGFGARERDMDAGSPLIAADLSPDGTRLVTVSCIGTADVWDIATGARAFSIDRGVGGVEWAAFHPRGGPWILTRASTGATTLCDARTGQGILEVRAGPGTVCAFDPVADRVAIADAGGSVDLLSLPLGTRIRTLARLGEPPGFLAFSPDGRRLLLATDRGEEGSALWIDTESGASRPLLGHEGRRVIHASFSPDGARFATASFDTTVRIWNSEDGAELAVRSARVRPVAVSWTADGRRLVTLNNERFVNVWFARNRPDLFRLAGHTAPVLRARFSPDSRSALTASADGTARLWAIPPAQGSREPGELLRVLRHGAPLTDACFAPEGNAVLTASVDGTARVWSALTGDPLCVPLAHPAAVLSAVFDDAGRRVLTVCADGKARLFHPGSEAEPIVFEGRSGSIRCAAFEPGGGTVAGGSDGGEIDLWDATDGRILRTLQFTKRASMYEGGVVALAFHPGREELAVACGDSRVRFWNPATGERSRNDAVLFPIRGVRFSLDGAGLLVTGRFGGGAAKLLRREKPPVQAANTHIASVNGGALSPDGSLVLTFAKDGSAHVWKAANGEPVAHRTVGDSAILDGSFDGSGASPRVITGCEDGTVHVWPVDPLAPARARKPRDIYPPEKERERLLALPLRFD